MDLYGEFHKYGTALEHTYHGLFWSWLNDYSPEKHRQYLLMRNVPFLKEFMQYSLDYRSDLEYMDRYNISWNQVHNPSKLSSSNSGSALVGSGLNYVSSNVGRLYK